MRVQHTPIVKEYLEEQYNFQHHKLIRFFDSSLQTG